MEIVRKISEEQRHGSRWFREQPRLPVTLQRKQMFPHVKLGWLASVFRDGIVSVTTHGAIRIPRSPETRLSCPPRPYRTVDR